MLERFEMDEAFSVYFDEIAACLRAKTFWALLHMTACLPDICAALEAANGEAYGNGYKDWADEFLKDASLDGSDWYELRCKILHQGRTIAKKSRYSKFIFSQPAADRTSRHKVVSGNEIELDVAELAREVVDGIRNWFSRLLSHPTAAATKNVEANLFSLVKLIPTASPAPAAAAQVAVVDVQIAPGTISPPTFKTSS